jgi:hypothetical protein
MKIREFARRTKRTGMWLTIATLVTFAFAAAIGSALSLFCAKCGSVRGLIPLFPRLVFPGVILWIASWIVEVFAKKET